MIVAELEIFHSRPIAPTRRLALGVRNLPIEPAPGAGGLLLAAIVAHSADRIEADLRESLYYLIEQLDAGERIAQPRVRHRFQQDKVGLIKSTHRLIATGDDLSFEFDDDLGRPVQQALGAVYATAALTGEVRGEIFNAIRNSLLWIGDVDARFMSQVMGGRKASMAELMAWNDPVAWALEILGLVAENDGANKRAVQRRFRTLLRDAHPDHGADDDDAAQRIADLTEARRILLAS